MSSSGRLTGPAPTGLCARAGRLSPRRASANLVFRRRGTGSHDAPGRRKTCCRRTEPSASSRMRTAAKPSTPRPRRTNGPAFSGHRRSWLSERRIAARRRLRRPSRSVASGPPATGADDVPATPVDRATGDSRARCPELPGVHALPVAGEARGVPSSLSAGSGNMVPGRPSRRRCDRRRDPRIPPPPDGCRSRRGPANGSRRGEMSAIQTASGMRRSATFRTRLRHRPRRPVVAVDASDEGREPGVVIARRRARRRRRRLRSRGKRTGRPSPSPPCAGGMAAIGFRGVLQIA